MATVTIPLGAIRQASSTLAARLEDLIRNALELADDAPLADEIAAPAPILRAVATAGVVLGQGRLADRLAELPQQGLALEVADVLRSLASLPPEPRLERAADLLRQLGPQDTA